MKNLETLIQILLKSHWHDTSANDNKNLYFNSIEKLYINSNIINKMSKLFAIYCSLFWIFLFNFFLFYLSKIVYILLNLLHNLIGLFFNGKQNLIKLQFFKILKFIDFFIFIWYNLLNTKQIYYMFLFKN